MSVMHIRGIYKSWLRNLKSFLVRYKIFYLVLKHKIFYVVLLFEFNIWYHRLSYDIFFNHLIQL